MERGVSPILLRVTPRFAMRREKRKRSSLKTLAKIFVSLGDILFFVFLACGVVILHYYYNRGELRVLPMLFVCLGYLLYRLTLGKIIMGVFCQIGYILGVCVRIVLYPFRRLGRAFLKICRLWTKKCLTRLAKKKKMRYNKIERERLLSASLSGFLDI